MHWDVHYILLYNIYSYTTKAISINLTIRFTRTIIVFARYNRKYNDYRNDSN